MMALRRKPPAMSDAQRADYRARTERHAQFTIPLVKCLFAGSLIPVLALLFERLSH